jgi:hypothetical protein
MTKELSKVMGTLKNKVDSKQQYEFENDKEFAIACGQLERYLLQQAPNEICRKTYCRNFLNNCFCVKRTETAKLKIIIDLLIEHKAKLDIDGKSNMAMAAILLYYTENKNIKFDDTYFYLGFYNNVNLLIEQQGNEENFDPNAEIPF